VAKIRLVAKIGSQRSVLTPFVAGSFLVHAALATAVLFAPAVKGGPRIAPNAIPVSIVALPGPKPKPRAKTPPAPAPEKPKPKPLPEKKAAPAPDQQPDRRAETSPTTSDSVPEPSTADTAGAEDDGDDPLFEGPGDGDGSSSVASLDILGSEFAWYNSSVTSKLTGNWQRPLLGGVKQTLSVVVGFTIRKDGSVTGVEILTSSGVPSVDRSVLRAVYDAAPLPRIPPQLNANVLPARFEFRWHPQR
jgi:TonB family protein